MRYKGYIFVAIFFIVLISIFYNIDFYSSIIPGWHTTIYPFWEVVFLAFGIANYGCIGNCNFLEINKNLN